jgi:hypothetical protein
MKSEIHEKVYGQIEWKHPRLEYRAADKNGYIWYYESLPVRDFDKCEWKSYGTSDFQIHTGETANSQDLWKDSLQTFQQYQESKKTIS